MEAVLSGSANFTGISEKGSVMTDRLTNLAVDESWYATARGIDMRLSK